MDKNKALIDLEMENKFMNLKSLTYKNFVKNILYAIELYEKGLRAEDIKEDD